MAFMNRIYKIISADKTFDLGLYEEKYAKTIPSVFSCDENELLCLFIGLWKKAGSVMYEQQKVKQH